jgi:hypothetical protein
LGHRLDVEEGGLMADPQGHPGYKLIKSLEPDEKMVSMIECKGRVYIATTKGLFRMEVDPPLLVEDKLEQVPFEVDETGDRREEPTHTCISLITPTSFSGGIQRWPVQSGRSTVLCDGKRFADGTVEGGCGESCSWAIGKSGYGDPPWPINGDGTRYDPTIPDEDRSV